MQIEVCIESVQTGIIAGKYGADRVELCSALDLGGLTPSAGIIQSCVENCDLQVFVMIRPRGGNFVYNDRELSIMKRDVELAGKTGANGVVFGCLDNNNEIDIKNNQELASIAKSFNLGVTFHRAFDFVKEMDKALEQIIKMGFDRILTSGGQATAIEGLDKIRYLANSQDSIEIMAGSGINAGNCRKFLNTGINAIHFTARKQVNKTGSLNMGTEYLPDEEKIKNIIKLTT